MPETFRFEVLEQAEWLASSAHMTTGAAYLDVDVIVDLQGFPEDHDPLEEICELPHVPDLLEHGRLLWVFNIVAVHLVDCPLSGRSHDGMGGRKRDVVTRLR